MQLETRDLDRIVKRHELQKIERNPVRRMFEPAVSPPVAGDVAARLVADGQGSRAPQGTSVVVVHIERLPRTIGDRIIRPGGELVLAAVHAPGGAAPFGRHLKAEGGIGHDVYPGGRRRLIRAEDRYIFPSVLSEAAETVEELEVRQRRRGLRLGSEGAPLRKWSGMNSPIRNPIKLIGKTPALSHEHRPRH